MTPEKKDLEYLDRYRDCNPIRKDGNLTLVDYNAINFQEFIDLENKENAIVFIPMGPLEVHGKYLPLGTDYLESYQGLDILKDVLKERRPDKKYTIIEFPGIPLGTGTNRGHPATVHHSKKTYYEVCKSLCDSLVRGGFRKIILFTFHHGMIHGYVMEEAAEKIMRKYKKLDVRIASPIHLFADTVFMKDPKTMFTEYIEKLGQDPLTEEELEAINVDHHAGMMEIALVQHLNEKLVDPSYKTAPVNREEMIDQLKGLLIRKYAAHPPCEPFGCGYNADPKFTDNRDWYSLFVEMGKDIVLNIVDAMFDEDPKAFTPYRNLNVWKQYPLGLNIARVLFLGANAKRNHLIIPIVLALIIIPWLLYIFK